MRVPPGAGSGRGRSRLRHRRRSRRGGRSWRGLDRFAARAVNLPDHGRGQMAAEPDRELERRPDGPRATHMRRTVEVAERVAMFEVEGRRYEAVADGQARERQL